MTKKLSDVMDAMLDGTTVLVTTSLLNGGPYLNEDFTGAYKARGFNPVGERVLSPPTGLQTLLRGEELYRRDAEGEMHRLPKKFNVVGNSSGAHEMYELKDEATGHLLTFVVVHANPRESRALMARAGEKFGGLRTTVKTLALFAAMSTQSGNDLPLTKSLVADIQPELETMLNKDENAHTHVNQVEKARTRAGTIKVLSG